MTPAAAKPGALQYYDRCDFDDDDQLCGFIQVTYVGILFDRTTDLVILSLLTEP